MVGARLLRLAGLQVSLGHPWPFVLVWSLMGHLWVGHRGLQTLVVLIYLVTWFIVFIEVKTLALRGVSGLCRDCKFDFAQLLCKYV